MARGDEYQRLLSPSQRQPAGGGTANGRSIISSISMLSYSSPDAEPAANNESGRPAGEGGTLTTFFGVFVPCVLSIFSVILFLRMGYILGQVGLVVALLMLIIAYGVVFLTILSISAISTNGVIKGGGAYYMISRSLGPELGGAIGIIFYFANVFASGLYVVGFVETLIQTVPDLDGSFWLSYGLRSAVMAVCLIVCIVGAEAFAKASFAIFVVVMLAVITVLVNFLSQGEEDNVPVASGNSYNESLIYTGFHRSTLDSNIDVDMQYDYSTGTIPTIPVVFGVLFNGCTGIMAGANMSGDLKNASESIPRGTLQAAAFTAGVYVFYFIFSAATCSRELLVNNYGYLQAVNRVPEIVMLGVFSATLSAALSTLIGASRILQAISRDNLLGDWFLIFSKEKKEPIRAVLMSWFLVQLVLLIGAINTIAPIVSMLFLLSYAVTNLACFVLSVTGAANFRPTFRLFSWHTAFAGAVACIVAMFVIEPTYAAMSILLLLICVAFIHYRHVPVSWGDVSQALIYHQVRKYLLRLTEQTTKYWRPQVLILAVNPRSHFNKVLFSNDLKKGGLFVLGHVVVDNFNENSRIEFSRAREAWLQLDVVAKVKAFVNCTISPSYRLGALSLMMTSGLGGMRPNIVIIGWYNEDATDDELIAWRDELETRKRKKMFVNLTRVHEVDNLMQYFPPMSESRAKRAPISLEDYVGVIDDALNLGKNVLVCRNFQSLPHRMRAAKQAVKENEMPWFIDLWPLLMTPGSLAQHSYEIILQLGSIVHRVQRWQKNTKLRICHFVERAEHLLAERERIEFLCNDLRIDAEVKVIALEVQPQQPAPEHTSFGLLENITGLEDAAKRFAEINNLISKYSERTCVVFTYLPPPSHFVTKPEQYLSLLDNLSQGLPPVVMCHGVEKVVTTREEAV